MQRSVCMRFRPVPIVLDTLSLIRQDLFIMTTESYNDEYRVYWGHKSGRAHHIYSVNANTSWCDPDSTSMSRVYWGQELSSHVVYIFYHCLLYKSIDTGINQTKRTLNVCKIEITEQKHRRWDTPLWNAGERKWVRSFLAALCSIISFLNAYRFSALCRI